MEDDVIPPSNKAFLLMIGPPGAGKSSAIRSIVDDEENSKVIIGDGLMPGTR
jgi:ABC-type Mn2+/Zn2+ transport system ATPase subunit